MLYETHMHTPLCKHAAGEPEEYAAVAKARGLSGIIVTCHNPLPDGKAAESRMTMAQWDEYLALVDRARQALRGITDVRLGLECDFLPGLESFLEKQIAGAKLHYVLGSVHPFIREYKQIFPTSDPVEFQAGYFGQLAAAAETRLFDCISHPDLVKNINPAEWQLARVMPHVQRCLDRIAATGVAMELNTSGMNKAIAEFNPSAAILREMRGRGIPCVVGADAHVPERVGDRYAEAYDALEAAGYTHVSLFLDRKRQDIPIAAARGCLKPSV